MNDQLQFHWEKMGHPLIPNELRICNDVDFIDKHFVILTGSNMSGKSTFLRSLGINMVLGSIGAPVCAENALMQPIPLLVAMRQSDSLNDGISYFLAEVQRLQQIMQKQNIEPCFILLDEILRGTNSDDKQTGTVEFIRKIISKNAIGCIATHDLEVCKLEQEYPEKLQNKCFEVEIVDNELVFDYTVRNGICKNKTATFLMKKMQII